MVVDVLPAAGEVWDGVWMSGCTWECILCDRGRSAGSRRGAKRSVHWVWAGVWEGCEGECGVHLLHTSPTPALFLHLTVKIHNPVLSSALSPFSSCSSLPTYSTPSPHLPHTFSHHAHHRQGQQPCPLPPVPMRTAPAAHHPRTPQLSHISPTPAQFLHLTDKINNPVEFVTLDDSLLKMVRTNHANWLIRRLLTGLGAPLVKTIRSTVRY